MVLQYSCTVLMSITYMNLNVNRRCELRSTSLLLGPAWTWPADSGEDLGALCGDATHRITTHRVSASWCHTLWSLQTVRRSHSHLVRKHTHLEVKGKTEMVIMQSQEVSVILSFEHSFSNLGNRYTPPTFNSMKTWIFHIWKRCRLNCKVKSGKTVGCQLRFYEFCSQMDEQAPLCSASQIQPI